MEMDSLFVNQTEIYEAITKLLSNFKKDGADRKTYDYCKRKNDILEAYWQDYQVNHRKICEIATSDHAYFRKQCFETAQKAFLSMKDALNKTVEQLGQMKQPAPSADLRAPEEKLPARPGTPSQSATPRQRAPLIPSEVVMSTKYKDLLKKQTINMKAFMRTVNNIKTSDLEKKWEFEDALKSLETRWSAIDKLHWEIEEENSDEDGQYQEDFNEHEGIFEKLKKEINTKMWSVSHREKSTPKIEIPSFNGRYQDWVSFKDLFSEAIHNNPSMSNAQKMQFLKGKVTGEAERLIHHLPISSENYEACWEILNHRYGNKRLIFTSHSNTLFGLPTMQQQSLVMIKKLHDNTKECLHAIQNLGVNIDTWDPLLVHLLAQKLDNTSFTEYMESVKKPRELPSLQEFLDFLESKFTTLEASRRKNEPIHQKTSLQANQPASSSYQHSNQKSTNQKNFSRTSYNNNSTKPGVNINTFHASRSTCGICNDDHGIWQCKQFIQMQPEQRLRKINQLNYCNNCLIDHNKLSCISTKRCRKCLASHNTLLHFALTKQNSAPRTRPSFQPVNEENVTKSSSSSHVSWGDVSEILLATAMIKVTGVDGTRHTMRALIDQGSQVSLINEKAAQVLGLKRAPCKGTIFGIGERENSAKGILSVTIQSIYSEYSFETSVIVMNSLIRRLPNRTISKPSWTHIQNIELADPNFNISRPVDLLLGAEVYSKIMLGGILRGNTDDQPIAQQTQLGWLLCGTMKPFYNCNVILHNTDDLLRFWENEDITQKIEMTSDDHECMQYFLKTTRRLENGRFEVRLPFKPEMKDRLGATRPQALAQFHNLERKLNKNHQLQTDYKKFMSEYLELNHMKLDTSNQTLGCYLPHHAVTREESTTTKLRVVFNASARSSSGHSLNDVMYRGPNLQQDLQELILKWRQYKYVYTADIEKMYRQIMIQDEDQAYQKIVWRDSSDTKILTYKLATLTYGTKPAGWLAMMCLKQLAKDERSRFPEAARELENNFYMDDYCGGSYTIDKANQLKSELIILLQKAGFNLRKWTSNKAELLAGLETDQCNQPTFEFKQTDSTKTLGLGWKPHEDKFIFKSKIESTPQNKPTKRSLLSDISKLFDPLGWLTPITTTMKIMFQKVWMLKVEWDESLPEEIRQEWSTLRRELMMINTIEVERWLGTEEDLTIELHGFCDASNKAYASVIYLKVVRVATTITLVAAKARLSPLNKETSIPRLELMGALLLSQLVEKVKKCLPDHETKVHCWTDSTAALGWIQGDPARWKPFVSNRVKAITSIVPAHQWHYVKTTENPADCASRGLSVDQLINHKLWWHGPSWLPSYNHQNKEKTIYETNLEQKKSTIKQTNVAVLKKDDQTITVIVNHLINKFSSITKITRILAWILRIPTYKKLVHRPYLELKELRRAKLIIIKNIQQSEFADDLHYLQKHGKVHTKSKILNLCPIKDDQGILRVGGRLRNAQMNHEMKHPIILPHNHRITHLLIDQAHQLTFHGGARLTLANLRQNYWIIGGYMATKKFVRQCVTCKRHDPTRHYQLMGDLPTARVNPENAFYHCGVDYTGFVDVKANKGRGIKTTKGYIAIFICMVTKAVHIELVSDLSSSAFLAALQRMSARRGAPCHMYSDNGTNFVGANRMLQEEIDHLKQATSTEFLTEITEMGIEWHFNVPSWPSAGGLWERAVRSLKHHLKRVIGPQKLTFEEYTTLLAKLEACLNSRPLCALSEDPEDLNFLTPAHFLSGRPGLTTIETEQDARTRWHLTSKLFQDLWKRWKTEYLSLLSARNKWTESQKNIAHGDLVVIQEDNLPAGKWGIGRVIDTHPGDDGLVRAVTLKTKNGLMKRPVVKLSILPVHKDDQPETKKNHTPPNHKPNEDRRTNKPREKETRIKPKRASVLATLFCFLMTMLILPTHGLHEITELPKNQSLYFDPMSKIQLIRDKWTLVVYYDMKPYWAGIETYNKISDYLDKLCTTIENQSHCNIIIQQARHDYQELIYYNELLLSQHFDVHARRRRRRGLINGVGYLANELFGVLDSRFAEQYVKDINTIQRNEKHLSNLWKNQTSVIEAEFNLMKRMEATMDKQHKIVNKKLNDLQVNFSILKNNIQNLSYVQDFTLTAMAGNSLLQSLMRLQDTLLDTITDIYHGQISLHLLTPTQLKRELHTIYSQIPSELTLPITNIETDIQFIYKLIRVKARATQPYIIIEVTFPLISREDFQLYKLIPIPHQFNKSMISITPVSEYVAVNLKKDSYFSLTTSELTTCLHHGEKYMCQLPKPIQNIKNDESFCDINTETNSCKINKSACENKWVELHSSAQYLYFCCDNYVIKVICGDQVTIRQLSQAGIIGMSQKCIIKGNDFSLFSLQHQSNQIQFAPDIYIPEVDQINHLINIKIPEPISTDDTNLNTSLSSLGEAVRKLKESDANVDDISPHHIHHYVVSYVFIAVVLCGGVIWMCKRKRPSHLCCGTTPSTSGVRHRRQGSAGTPPPPRPSRRCRREPAVTPPPPRIPTTVPVHSEVLSVDNLCGRSDSEIVYSCAKRWPSARYASIKKPHNNQHSNIKKNTSDQEDTIV